MRKEGLAPAPGCEWDKGGGFTKSGPGDSQMHSPRSFFLSVSYGPISGHRVAARGKRRWTGATPPFCCPVRARGRCAIHICATPPGGVAPVQIIPRGKAREWHPDGQDGSSPDIFKERLEALRKQALDRLRAPMPWSDLLIVCKPLPIWRRRQPATCGGSWTQSNTRPSGRRVCPGSGDSMPDRPGP